LTSKIEGMNSVVADEDQALVLRSQKGDLKAFEALVEKHQKRMLNLAFRMLGDYEEACDAVQEAFLDAFRAIKKFRGEAKFSSWLYGIVLNQARTHRRQLAGQMRIRSLSLDDPPEDESGRRVLDPPSQEASALEQLEKKEIEAKVQSCINLLEADQREVLVLRDIQGHSYEEIQQILGLPEGTVKSRLYRAREALKNEMKEVAGDL
jgi:RNA polymerase sigma-70 factor, ECF subfamily